MMLPFNSMRYNFKQSVFEKRILWGTRSSCRHDLGKAIWPPKCLWNDSMDDFFDKNFFLKDIVFMYGCQMALATIRISYTYICNITSLKKSKFNNYPSLAGFILLTLEWEETEANGSFLIPTYWLNYEYNLAKMWRSFRKNRWLQRKASKR